jgi:hypothetical protein
MTSPPASTGIAGSVGMSRPRWRSCGEFLGSLQGIAVAGIVLGSRWDSRRLYSVDPEAPSSGSIQALGEQAGMIKVRSVLLLALFAGQLVGLPGFFADDCCSQECSEEAAAASPPPCTYCHCCFTSQAFQPTMESLLEVPHCAGAVSVSHDDAHAPLMSIDIFHVPKSLPA